VTPGRTTRAATEPAGEHENGSSAWSRALTVLEMLGAPEGAEGLGVVEIARRLGRDKSSVSRMLRGLAEEGYVEREPRSGRYRLGARLFALAAHAVDERLRAEADLLVERESVRLGERVEVGVRTGGLCLTLATAAPGLELRTVGWVGRTVPLAGSALGRALLADLADDDVARLVVLGGLPGAVAPRSLDALLVGLRDDRRRGWTLADDDAGGLAALAVPVRDATRRVVAAVGLSGPRSRLASGLEEAAAALVAAAGALSGALGGPPCVRRSVPTGRPRGPAAARFPPTTAIAPDPEDADT
jgi:DNA-binding IclR family transcriptional regulator